MEKYSEVIERLKKDKLKNINLLNFIENNSVISLETASESVLLRGKSDRQWIYVSSTNEDELRILKSKLNEKDKTFGAIEEWMMPILSEDKELLWELSMVQYYLPENIEIPNSEFNTTSLSQADAKIVYENSEYKDFISIDYIKDRIQRGISVGIYEADKLVAWGLTQDDSAMGFLHVLKDFRRKGYGYNVTLSLIDEVRKAGKIPFAYIEEDNLNSINLVLKLGFKRDKKVHWFGVK